MNRRNDIDESREEIFNLLKSGMPRAEVARIYKCKDITLATRLKMWGLADFKNPARKGIPKPEIRTPAINYLELNGKRIASSKLRLKLIRDGIKEAICEMCRNNEWLGKPISLELHHVNGNRFDNRLDNLQILCPNCHSLTPNHSRCGSD